MKKSIIILAFLATASVALADVTWLDIQTITNQAAPLVRHRHSYTMTFNFETTQRESATVHLDRSFFGRAQAVGGINIASDVANAWSQGFTGQNVEIGVFDYLDAPANNHVSLFGVNTNVSNRVTTTWRLQLDSANGGGRNHQSTSTIDRPTTNDGNFTGYYSHQGAAGLIIGGRHVDADGTLMYGIAKDANLTNLHAGSPRFFTRETIDDIMVNRWSNQFTSRRFDFINASLSSTHPTERLSATFKQISTTDI